MCLIVDTNLAALVFGSPTNADFLPIIEWLTSPKGNGRLVVGGQLAHELEVMNTVRRFLRGLQQAGRARFIPQSEIALAQQALVATGRCVSNDPHVIALAQISGARVLCSQDKNLHTDFKNKQLIDKPRGRVYQTAKHARLLCHTKACR
jgi:hypothetical protein